MDRVKKLSKGYSFFRCVQFCLLIIVILFQNDRVLSMSFADRTSELWLEIDQLHLKYLQHDDNVLKVGLLAFYFDKMPIKFD